MESEENLSLQFAWSSSHYWAWVDRDWAAPSLVPLLQRYKWSKGRSVGKFTQICEGADSALKRNACGETGTDSDWDIRLEEKNCLDSAYQSLCQIVLDWDSEQVLRPDVHLALLWLGGWGEIGSCKGYQEFGREVELKWRHFQGLPQVDPHL